MTTIMVGDFFFCFYLVQVRAQEQDVMTNNNDYPAKNNIAAVVFSLIHSHFLSSH